jgi:hypothetical protein
VIRRLAALVDHPAPITGTVREVTGRPVRTFTDWTADDKADFTTDLTVDFTTGR